jgi:hypothetical protein
MTASDPYLAKLFAGIRGDDRERISIVYPLRRVTVIWKDGARIRRSPYIANNIVRTAKTNDTFETYHEEMGDLLGNLWIQIVEDPVGAEGFICTFYNGTLRATVEILPIN